MNDDGMNSASLLLPKVEHFVRQLKELGWRCWETASWPSGELQMNQYPLFVFGLCKETVK
jgi:hypothetical protein